MEMSIITRPGGESSSHRGSSTWLARGLQIQQSQIHLRVDMKALFRATEAQKLEVVRWRARLETDIDQFLSQASTYIGQANDDNASEGLEWDADWSDAEGGDADEDQDVEEALGNFNPHHAEEARLPLPSALGQVVCGAVGIEWLANQELELRQGEANDALHNLRIALADKAILF